jgi:cytochrome P450
MSATSLGGSFHLVTSGDTKLKKSFGGGLKLASLQAQIPIVKYVPFVAKAVTATMDNTVEEIIARRQAETGPPKRDIVQIIMDAHKADPIHFPEQRVRDEIKLFM